jgi:hypothetical protein
VAIAVAEQAGGEHGGGEDQEVARGEPLQVGLRRVQRLGQRREGHAEHRAVHAHAQDGQEHRAECPPLLDPGLDMMVTCF